MENLEVKILDQREVVHFPKPGHPQLLFAVTYAVGNGIPGVVYIPKEEFSDERMRNEIREQLKRSSTEGPRIVKL